MSDAKKPRFQLNTAWAQKMLDREEPGGGGSGIKWDKPPKAGEYSFRVLPPDPTTGQLGFVTGDHWNIPGIKGTITSLSVTHADMLESADQDPIALALKETEGKIAKEAWDSMQVSTRTIILVTDVRGELNSGKKYKPEDIVALTFGGDFTMRWLLSQLMDPDSSSFIDPFYGNRLKFSRSDKNSSWDRKILPSGGPIGGSDEACEEILKKFEELKFYENNFKYPDAEQLKKIEAAALAIRGLAAQSRMQEGDKMASVAAKISTPSSETAQETKVESVVTQSDAERVANVAAQSAAVIATKPASAPDCFGNADSYDPDSAKCLQCPFEMDCGSAV